MGEETELTTSEDVLAAEGVTADEPSKENRRKRKKLLHKSLLELMEFYLGDVNLSKDRFMSQLIQGQPFVYADLSVFLTFNKVKALTSNIKDLAKAVSHSEILQLSEDGTQVCRKTPIKKKENEDECTIYVEQLGPDVDHDLLIKVFSEYGPVDYVSMPKFPHNGKFKGFAFVEFRDSESAKRALEVLSAKGCCLSPHMAPEELASIRSFDVNKDSKNEKNRKHAENNQNENNEETIDVKEQHKKKNKRKHSGDEVVKQISDVNLEQNCDEEGESKQKKIKPDSKPGPVETRTSQTEETEDDMKKKKRKHSTDEKLKETSNLSEEQKCDEELEHAKKKVKSDTEENLEAETEEALQTDETVEDSSKQKKRKRKKKVKKDKSSATSLGLKVLSKKEWKHLRSKYLNMQREMMSLLKQQLYSTKFEDKKSKPDVSFKQGTVVKVTLEEPVTNVNTTKSELRIHPEIRYVDATEGSPCVYLRTTTPEVATTLVQAKHWPAMDILQGSEETAYWNKIKKDRDDHFQKKQKPNKRGRTKLLKRAEKFQEKQI